MSEHGTRINLHLGTCSIASLCTVWSAFRRAPSLPSRLPSPPRWLVFLKQIVSLASNLSQIFTTHLPEKVFACPAIEPSVPCLLYSHGRACSQSPAKSPVPCYLFFLQHNHLVWGHRDELDLAIDILGLGNHPVLIGDPVAVLLHILLHPVVLGVENVAAVSEHRYVWRLKEALAERKLTVKFLSRVHRYSRSNFQQCAAAYQWPGSAKIRRLEGGRERRQQMRMSCKSFSDQWNGLQFKSITGRCGINMKVQQSNTLICY